MGTSGWASCPRFVGMTFLGTARRNALSTSVGEESRQRIAIAARDVAVKHAHYQEIKAYLDQRGKSLANWRALDDAVLEFPKECEQLILCNPNTGVTQSQVQAVSDWLNAKGSSK